MQREAVTSDLSKQAFEFFFWFSRFEFALKANDYLKSHKPGDNAEPGWDEFVEKWAGAYKPSAEAAQLLAKPPERQVIGDNGKLDWKAVGLADCKSDLARVARLVKTVRNNLFHGGKSGGKGWDDPARTRALLEVSQPVLDQLAQLAGIEADFRQYY